MILPLTAVFFGLFLFLFRVLQTEQEVQRALVYAGREAAVFGAEASEEELSALCFGFFYEEAGESARIGQYVVGKAEGIALTESVEEDCLTLCASYRIFVPIAFFSIGEIHLTVVSKNRIWSGRTAYGSGAYDPIVYYTASGSVYHLTKSCTYLQLSIQSVARDDVEALRNKSGGKYYPCTKCGAGDLQTATVYITDYGTEYHASLQCSSLKRTIYEARLSEVKDRSLCQKCAKGE